MLSALFDIEKLLGQGGLALAAFIIFAETGLLIGFFLPGDSLLFVAGFLASKPEGLPHLPSIGITASVLIVAAFLGNQVGYWIGCTFGPAVFDKPESRFFSQKNVVRTQVFFDRHGKKAISAGPFRADRAHVRAGARRRRQDGRSAPSSAPTCWGRCCGPED